MALTVGTSVDVVVKLQDRGPVDGSLTALSLVTITALARKLTVSSKVGKRISVSGFSASDLFRPGKTYTEITLEFLISYSSRITTTAGNYVQINYTIASNSEVLFCGFVESAEDDINDDGEAIVRVMIVGPVDGGAVV